MRFFLGLFIASFAALPADFVISSPYALNNSSNTSISPSVQMQDEHVFVAWSTGAFTGGEIQYSLLDKTNGLLTDAQTLADSSDLNFNITSAMNRHGVGLIIWNTGGTSGGSIKYAAYDPSTDSFGSVKTIGGESFYRPAVAIFEDGTGFAIWNTGGASGGKIHYASYNGTEFVDVKTMEDAGDQACLISIGSVLSSFRDKQKDKIVLIGWNTNSPVGGAIEYSYYDGNKGFCTKAKRLKGTTPSDQATHVSVNYNGKYSGIMFNTGGTSGPVKYSLTDSREFDLITTVSDSGIPQKIYLGPNLTAAELLWATPSNVLLNLLVVDIHSRSELKSYYNVPGTGPGSVYPANFYDMALFTASDNQLSTGNINLFSFNLLNYDLYPYQTVPGATGFRPNIIINEFGYGFIIWPVSSAGTLEYSTVSWTGPAKLINILNKFQTVVPQKKF